MPPDHMRLRLRSALVGAALLSGVATVADDPVIRARAVDPTVEIKIFDPAGTIRLVGWDRDSIVVRGRVAAGEHFFFSGDAHALKLGILDRSDDRAAGPSQLVIYVPRRSRLSVKAVTAAITGSDVSGWFYTVSGAIALTGSVAVVEAEAMSGNVTLDVAAPWVHARTGDGRLLVRGAPQDVDASTITGTLEIASPAVLRGRFASVSGDILYAGAPPGGGILDFSNHSGAVDLLLPSTAAALLDLSTVAGEIENGLTRVRPVAERGGHGQSLHLDVGRDGAHVTVRTFKGTIRLRTQ